MVYLNCAISQEYSAGKKQNLIRYSLLRCQNCCYCLVVMVIRRVDVINQFIVLFHKRLICIWFVVVHPHTKGAQIIDNFLTIYQSWHEIQVNDQS